MFGNLNKCIGQKLTCLINYYGSVNNKVKARGVINYYLNKFIYVYVVRTTVKQTEIYGYSDESNCRVYHLNRNTNKNILVQINCCLLIIVYHFRYYTNVFGHVSSSLRNTGCSITQYIKISLSAKIISIYNTAQVVLRQSLKFGLKWQELMYWCLGQEYLCSQEYN